MRKIRKILAVVFSMLLASFSLAACEIPNEDLSGSHSSSASSMPADNSGNSSVTEKPTPGQPDSENGNSKTEEIAFHIAYSDMSLKRNAPFYGTSIEAIVTSLDVWTGISDELPDFKKEYDEEFFSNNVLIVFILGRGSQGATLENVEVLRKDGELIVKVFSSNGALDVITEWALVLEVTKNDLHQVLNVHLETDFSSFNYIPEIKK